MRPFNFFSFLVFKQLSFCTLFLLSACSSSNDVNNSSVKALSTKASISSNTTEANNLEHIHTSNPCTAEMTHNHKYEKKEHQHSYDCENTNAFISNAHVHEATEVSKKFRHVHPNGANKHSHH